MEMSKLKGNWNQVKGSIKQKWAKLTDDDLLEIEGKKDVLVGKLQERYGHSKEAAEKTVQEFEDQL